MTAVAYELRRGRETTGALAVLTAGLAGFGLLSGLVVAGEGLGWDAEGPRAADAYYELEGAWRATNVMLDAAIALGAACAVVGLCLFLIRREWRRAAFWTVAVGGVFLLEPVLKAAFARPGIGPSADEHSFPSGTAMVAAALLTAGAFLLHGGSRQIVVAAGAAVLLAEGTAIVLLGWHYPSDVLAGWCIAAAWVTAAWLGLEQPGLPEEGSG
jgi:membrane-associated phospholipid phosphatase